jgi:hypothetical protein
MAAYAEAPDPYRQASEPKRNSKNEFWVMMVCIMGMENFTIFVSQLHEESGIIHH